MSATVLPIREKSSRKETLEDIIKAAKKQKRALKQQKKCKRSKRRKTSTSRQKKDHEMPGNLEDQLSISVSKMRYCPKKRQGIIARPIEKCKVYLHKSAKYDSVLKKIQQELFSPKETPTSQYYLADSSGYPLCREDGIVSVQDKEGKEKLVPWTLEFYMAISGIKYQSKVNLYVVEKNADHDDINVTTSTLVELLTSKQAETGPCAGNKEAKSGADNEHLQTECVLTGGSAGRADHERLQTDGLLTASGSAGLGDHECLQIKGLLTGSSTSSTSGAGHKHLQTDGLLTGGSTSGADHEHLQTDGLLTGSSTGADHECLQTSSADGLLIDDSMLYNVVPTVTSVPEEQRFSEEQKRLPFEPNFIVVTPSKYREEYSIRQTTQRGIVERFSLADTDEHHIEIHQDTLLYPANPCHQNGTYLSSISVSAIDCVTLVKDVNMKDGELSYFTPYEGMPFCNWTGCFASNKIAMLCSVALNGFHSRVLYQWFRNGMKLEEDTFPVAYVEAHGRYTCTITDQMSEKVLNSATFEVEPEMTVHPVYGSDTQHKLEIGSEIVVGSTEDVCQPSAVLGVHLAVQESVCELTAAIRSQPDLLSEEQFDQIHIVKEIGRGSFGTVYQAIWRGTIVAAKIVQAEIGTEAYTCLIAEIGIIRNINHPNILNLFEVVKFGASGIAILTNYVRGHNLFYTIFNQGVKLTYDEKMAIAVQLTQAIAFCHTQQPPLIHMDIKPANILVEQETKHVYLADFGLTRLLTGTVSTLTSVKGTPGFQAPEVLQSEPISTSCDIYALGCVLIELFSGALVWGSAPVMTILTSVVIKKMAPSTEKVPVMKIKNVCEACTRFDPQKRPTALQCLHDLVN